MRHTPKENVLRTLRHAAPDHIPYAGDGSLILVDHQGRKPPQTGADAWGVIWAPLPETYQVGAREPAESYPRQHPAASAVALLERPFPDPTDPALFTGLLQNINPNNSLVVGQHSQGPLDRLSCLLGMPRALLALRSEGAACRDVLERIADYHVGIAHGYLAAGVEAGFLADDYAGQGGPMLDPALWRAMILPGLARVIDVYRQADAPVFFHTCGRAEAFIPELLDAGVTAFNLQSSACDLAALKRRFGRRIAFYGGIASETMLTGSPVDVERATREAIAALWDEGGLILAPDQPLAYPAENTAIVTAIAREYQWL